MVVYSDYATVEVAVIIADETDQTFQYTYNRNMAINKYDPPYGFYDFARTLIVQGQNFLPHPEIN